MASRNLARGGSQEHENAEARLQTARERRDLVEDRRDTADASGEGAFEASVALQGAEEEVAAREAWTKWVNSDY
jgi:hypothetical protein